MYKKLHSTLNKLEVNKFSNFDFWNLNGPAKHLHLMNPLRTQVIQNYIKEMYGDKKCNILDVGCGGGILSESLHKLGHNVTGIDANPNSIRIAKEHCKDIEYLNIDVSKLDKSFDVVVSMEVLEHVDNPNEFVKECSSFSNGLFIISTINRNFVSFLGTYGSEKS